MSMLEPIASLSHVTSSLESEPFLPIATQSQRPGYKRYLALHIFHPTITFITSLPPRFVQRGGLKPKKTLGPTSYLDALRGWAAFIVVNHHGFPYADLPIFRYPIFSLLTAGRAMVDVFFVISGFVLGVRYVLSYSTSCLYPRRL